METTRAIHQRASLKARLSSKEVEHQAILKVLEAARAAPSARNTQPTRFVVVKDPQRVKSIVREAFSEGNQPVAQAPVLIFICANPADGNVHDGVNYYHFDAGLATENLVVAATDLGLATHIMTGFKEFVVKRLLGIPEEVRVIAATPLSCPAQGSYEKAAEERLASRKRKSLEEIVSWDSWGAA